MTLARPVLKKATVLITRRTTQRQFLLKPCKDTNQAWLYCLGLAAQDHGVELHGTCAESNHHHTPSTDHLGKLPEFLRDLHGRFARVMNAKWKRWENFWSTEQTSVVELATPEDAFDKLVYAVTNPAKDHLVERARHWPGVSSIKPEYRHGEFVVRRPHWFFDKDGDMPAAVTIRFTRPPGFEHLTEEEWRNKLDAAIEAVEERAANERKETGAPILGVKAIRRQSAFDQPASSSPRRQLSPRVACKDTKRRIRILTGRKQWLADYRKALEAYREGDKAVLFPFGTYLLRVDTHVLMGDGPGILVPPYATTLRAA